MISKSTILTIFVSMLLAAGVWFWLSGSRNLQSDYAECLETTRNYERDDLNDANCRATALFWQSTRLVNRPRRAQLGEQIIGLYDEILTELPEDGPALYQRAGAHQMVGNYDAALADFDRLIAVEGQDVSLLESRASLHETVGDEAAALADYLTIQQVIENHNWQQLYPAAMENAEKRIAELTSE